MSKIRKPGRSDAEHAVNQLLSHYDSARTELLKAFGTDGRMLFFGQCAGVRDCLAENDWEAAVHDATDALQGVLHTLSSTTNDDVYDICVVSLEFLSSVIAKLGRQLLGSCEQLSFTKVYEDGGVFPIDSADALDPSNGF